MEDKPKQPERGSEGSDHEPEDHEHFHYLDGFVAVEPDHVDAVLGATESIQLGVDELAEQFGFDLETQGESVSEMLGQIAVVGIADDDPQDLSRRLRSENQDLQVAPIHALGTQSHWATMTGTDPTPIAPPKGYEFDDADPDLLIAAIDSGVTANMPPWLTGIEFDSPADIETPYPLVASHGVFVAGLIRMNAPEYTVRLARARSRPISAFRPRLRPIHRAGHNPSTELDLAEAMFRLVQGLSGRKVAALNVSLGGYADPDDPLLLPTRKAVDHWLENFPDTPIFAPAGNRDDDRAVYPAAFEEVIGVAGTEGRGGREVVWDAAGRLVAAPNRWWVSEYQNGVDLEGPGGVRSSPWVRWSGSSFATALATASYV